MAQRTIQPALRACEQLFDAILPRFKREMRRPVITIQTKGRRNAMAWYWANRWQNGETGLIPEINICAEYINSGLHETANSVFHEMVHYANWLDQVKDCSASQYHNLHFKRRCESVGLICEKWSQARYGWAMTQLSEELVRLVESLGIDEDVFSVVRVSLGKATGTRGSKMKK